MQTHSKFLLSLVATACAMSGREIPLRFQQPKPPKEKESDIHFWGASAQAVSGGFNFSPRRNQRITRKNRRRSFAAGNKHAFRN